MRVAVASLVKTLPLCAFLALGACAVPQTSPHPTRATLAENALPPVKTFRAQPAALPTRSNADIARDFLDLSFELESGRTLPYLTRFDGPITVKLEGQITPILQSDLNQLIDRLRREAKIDIRQITEGEANIAIQSVEKSAIKRALPHAACFVVPNVTTLTEYRRSRGAVRTDWTQLQSRERLAIFLPFDTSPQDMRDCLHEELAQAIGPLNDLYRLDDSVFNDDNVHAVLTGFDMLILRAYYHPSLRNGMSKGEVAQRLPAILNQINPQGNHSRFSPLSRTDDAWKDAVQTALGPTGTPSRRKAAAQRMVVIAQTKGWTDHRRGFSHYVYGRVTQFDDSVRANQHYQLADQYFRASSPDGPHRSSVAAPLAAFALSRGNAQEALRIIDANIPAAKQFQNAVTLANLLMLKSEAHEALGQTVLAQNAQFDSLGWARYGLGPDWIVRAKQREVALLNPNNRTN